MGSLNCLVAPFFTNLEVDRQTSIGRFKSAYRISYSGTERSQHQVVVVKLDYVARNVRHTQIDLIAQNVSQHIAELVLINITYFKSRTCMCKTCILVPAK